MVSNHFKSQTSTIAWFSTVSVLPVSNLLSFLPAGEPYCSVPFYIVLVTWDLHKYTLKVRHGFHSSPSSHFTVLHLSSLLKSVPVKKKTVKKIMNVALGGFWSYSLAFWSLHKHVNTLLSELGPTVVMTTSVEWAKLSEQGSDRVIDTKLTVREESDSQNTLKKSLQTHCILPALHQMQTETVKLFSDKNSFCVCTFLEFASHIWRTQTVRVKKVHNSSKFSGTFMHSWGEAPG